MLRSAALMLLLLGDLNFTGLQYMTAFQKAGYDPAFSFQQAAPTIRAADIAVANLEGPLTFADWSPESKGRKWRFRQLPLFAKGIKAAGIDVLLLGNNHIADAGAAGIQDTVRALTEEGLSWVPSPREGPLVVERSGVTIELWNADLFSRAESHPWAVPAGELVSIITARYQNGKVSRHVIAFIHGHFPAKGPMDELAARLRGSGVDWVIFGGNHTPAGMTADQHGGVHFGLGDLLFGCECSGAAEGKALVLQAGVSGILPREIALQLGQPANGYVTTVADLPPSER